ncbi:hypothetical protein SAMN05216466_104190 [Paraburkholderia phenazinium]|uniref:Uncharacterized protein n=1 Tax=Paraburkholderia phenazinium TaxID=60549 RepID=A0A1G7VRN7_9BURK|nr:hypothetical protein SAMN05216466_104190 [Paraburkholderia phenazinium]
MEHVRQFTRYDPGSTVAALLRVAIEKTIATDDPLYGRLPPPVRYRATGAIEAWKRVMEAGRDRGDADFHAALPTFPLTRLYNEFPRFVGGWGRSDPSELSDEDMALTHRSLIWQIYHASQGAMYEPTVALHRLLDSAWIADDVPVSMIELPAPAICIVPNPEWPGCKQGIRTIVLFSRQGEADRSHYKSLTMATWQEFKDGGMRVKYLEYPWVDSGKTIQQVLEDQADTPMSEDEVEADRQHWRLVFDYAVKLLLYLKIPGAQVYADRAYSNASGEFKGLGQRKRKERLAQIEHLYDRHIVGPAVLDWEQADHIRVDAELVHHEKRGHWRRPHFKMQPHGPHSSLRKLVFIGPTIVRPDRIGL